MSLSGLLLLDKYRCCKGAIADFPSSLLQNLLEALLVIGRHLLDQAVAVLCLGIPTLCV